MPDTDTAPRHQYRPARIAHAVGDLRLQYLDDPVVAAQGVPWHHPVAEDAWLPIVGPGSWCLFRRMNRLLADGERHGKPTHVLHLADLAADTGLGYGQGGKNTPANKTLWRLHSFGLARIALAGADPTIVQVRPVLAPPSRAMAHGSRAQRPYVPAQQAAS